MKRLLTSALFALLLLFTLSSNVKADVIGGGGCGPGSGSTIDPTCTGTLTIGPTGASSGGIGVSLTNISGLTPTDPPFMLADLTPNAAAWTFSFSASSVTGVGTFNIQTVDNTGANGYVYYSLTGDITSFAEGPGNTVSMVLAPTANSFYDPSLGAPITLLLNGTSGNNASGAGLISYIGDPTVTSASVNFDISASQLVTAPEPGTAAFLLIGIFGLLLFARRYGRSRNSAALTAPRV